MLTKLARLFPLKQIKTSSILYKSLSSTRHVQETEIKQNKIEVLEHTISDISVPKTVQTTHKIDSQELFENITKTESTADLFDLLVKHNSSFDPNSFLQLVKKWSRLSCYDADKNEYFVRDVAQQIPYQLDHLLVKQTIKQVPHFEWDMCLQLVERFAMLGFDSNQRCVRAVLQVLKYHINSFDLKNLIRFKECLTHLSKMGVTQEVAALQNGLDLCVKSKQTSIYSINMKIKILRAFPTAFDDKRFEEMCNSMLEDWQNLSKEQRNSLIEMVLERNVLNQDIFKKIKKVLVKYMKNKASSVSDSFGDLDSKREFLARLTNFSSSLMNNNLYVDYLCDGLINCQLEFARSIIDEENGKCDNCVASCLNTLLEFCLKFNYHSPELLAFVNMGLNEQWLVDGTFKLDLFLFYAGTCNFTDLSEQSVSLCQKYVVDKQPNADVLMNALKGLLWLNNTVEADRIARYLKADTIDFKLYNLDFICKRIYTKQVPQAHKIQIQAYFMNLMGENERDYCIKESDTSFGVLENLVDFEITRKLDNKKCFVYIEGRNERFRNLGQLLNSSEHRVYTTKRIIENLGDGAFFWYIKKKSNAPLSLTMEDIQTLFEKHQTFNESLF